MELQKLCMLFFLIAFSVWLQCQFHNVFGHHLSGVVPASTRSVAFSCMQMDKSYAYIFVYIIPIFSGFHVFLKFPCALDFWNAHFFFRLSCFSRVRGHDDPDLFFRVSWQPWISCQQAWNCEKMINFLSAARSHLHLSLYLQFVYDPRLYMCCLFREKNTKTRFASKQKTKHTIIHKLRKQLENRKALVEKHTHALRSGSVAVSSDMSPRILKYCPKSWNVTTSPEKFPRILIFCTESWDSDPFY